MAEVGRLLGLLFGMEFVAAGKGHDATREETTPLYADDFFAAARD